MPSSPPQAKTPRVNFKLSVQNSTSVNLTKLRSFATVAGTYWEKKKIDFSFCVVHRSTILANDL